MKSTLSTSQVKSLFKNNKSFFSKNFTILKAKVSFEDRLFAVCVSKKLGNAVRRNYIKRVFRSLYYNNQKPIGHIAFIPKPNVEAIPYKDLEQEYIGLLEKWSLCEKQNNIQGIPENSENFN